MTEQEYNDLRETSWRRPLDPTEEARIQAYLTLNPDAQSAWESDADLTQLLGQVPNAPLASNFTSQVLAALDREERLAARPAPAGAWADCWRRLFPRLAWGFAALFAAVAGYQQYQAHRHEKLTQALVQVTHANGWGAPSIFQDFEVIQRLGQVPQPADEELWLVLSQAQAR